MAIGSCEPNTRRCSSTIGSSGATFLHLVVFNCRSSIAILPRRQHVLRYVRASIDCCVILDCIPRLFRGRSCKGIVDGNVLFLHRCEGKVRAVEGEERANLLSMNSE